MLANTAQGASYNGMDLERIGPVGTIVQLVLITSVSILFNFFPERIGVVKSLADLSTFSPLLAPEFQVHMRALNLYWGLATSLCRAHLVLRRWNIITRSADIGLNMLLLGILFQMVLGGPLAISTGITLAIKFGLSVAIIATGLAVITQIRVVADYRMR